MRRKRKPRRRSALVPALAESAVGRRPKRNYARWRALSLSLVYLVFAAHIIHWKVTGKTLAPLELNEVMYTLELGIITAGFIFMCLLVLGTLIFGRFFCSWACHIMVLQDLCAWVLRRLRIRPKPIRARILLLVPPLTAFYMFIWPQILRAWRNRAFPEFHFRTDTEGWASFVTNNFWRNLPTPSIIALTFVVCGFVIIYFLGSRTFCTYVCPYGAVFALADRFAPGRIRVTDACQQCGTCTATCTSGVRVHEDVGRHGMIVNPACLKDLDCVAACPQGALQYRFGKPSLLRSYASGGRFGLPYNFSVVEEVLIGLVFLVVLVSFRGLYNRVPFLLSLALGAIFGYLAVVGVRMFTRPSVTLSTLSLKNLGRLTSVGLAYCGMGVLLTALVVHSSFVRYHEYRGLVQASALEAAPTPEAADHWATSAFRHLTTAEKWGLLTNVRAQRALATVSLQLHRYQTAETYARRVLQRLPGESRTGLLLGQSLAAQQRFDEADQVFRSLLDHPSADQRLEASTRKALAGVLAVRGDFAGAADQLDAALVLDPQCSRARAELGAFLAELGRFDRAVAELREAVRLDPKFAEAHYNLGTVLAYGGDLQEAVLCYERALALAPDDAEAHNNLALALMNLGKTANAQEHLEQAISISPDHASAHFNLANLLAAEQRMDLAAEHYRIAARKDRRYRQPLLGETP